MATIDLLIQCANRLEKDFPDQLATFGGSCGKAPQAPW